MVAIVHDKYEEASERGKYLKIFILIKHPQILY